jgi:endoglucanase
LSRLGIRSCSSALAVSLLTVSAASAQGARAIHLNQTGFLEHGPKRATVVTDAAGPFAWTLETAGGAVAASGETTPFGFSEDAGHAVHTIDFSDFDEAGDGFVLKADGAESAPFAIAADLYRPLKYDALAFFYHQRSGIEIDADLVGAEWARPAAHAPDMATCYRGKDDRGDAWRPCAYTLDVSRGWYDAGDHGKYVVNGGISVWTLLNYYERIENDPARRAAFEDGAVAIPEAGNGVSDLLDEARWELDFLLAMQVPEGTKMMLPRGDQTRAKKLKFSEVDASGLVHHKMHDENWTPLPTPPHLDKEKRYLSYPSTAATLNLAASAAQCARVFRGVDDDYAAQCLSAAEKAYAAAKRLPDILAYQVTEGGGGAYGDSTLEDEFYWAAAELYAATGDEKYRDDVTSSPHFLAAPKGDAGSTNDIFWSGVQTLGTLTLLLSPENLSEKERTKARAAIVAAADAFLAQSEKDGYGAPFGRSYNWGSNGDMANRGVVMAYAYDATDEEKYRSGVVAVTDYLLGRNPLGQSYVSGYGENPMKAPHHRFWAKAADPSLPGPPPGALAGGPNESSSPDPISKRVHSDCVAQTCYADEVEAYSLNEVAINWNAPLFWIAAFLDEETAGRDSHD